MNGIVQQITTPPVDAKRLLFCTAGSEAIEIHLLLRKVKTTRESPQYSSHVILDKQSDVQVMPEGYVCSILLLEISPSASSLHLTFE